MKKFNVDPDSEAEVAPEVDDDPTPLDEELDKRCLSLRMQRRQEERSTVLR